MYYNVISVHDAQAYGAHSGTIDAHCHIDDRRGKTLASAGT